MAGPIASVIFIGRGLDKVQHGDISRAPVVAAQVGSLVNNAKVDGVFKQISALDDIIPKASDAAVQVVTTGTAETTTKNIINFGSKALDVAGKLVNPLIIASTGVHVLVSDDKEKTLYTEGLGLAGMFTAEKIMKDKAIKEGIKDTAETVMSKLVDWLANNTKLIKDISKTKSSALKIGALIATGIAFAAASIGGYMFGSKLGSSIIDEKRSRTEQKNIERK